MSVLSVSLSPAHDFSKQPQSSIRLLANHGVENDSHAGTTVQHRSRLRITPAPPNLRQVHLIQSELFAGFRGDGHDLHGGAGGKNTDTYEVRPGDLGENITTVGIDLLGLGRGTRLVFLGDEGVEEDRAVVVVMGLRNPCWQIDKFKKGLQERCLVRDEERRIVGRKAGVMGVVAVGGVVRPGMRVVVEAPDEHLPLECV
ncbi:MAG: hypothetical protein M1816_006359 [Peltula sp. TS41687]|nr:MAG: hypothetical protein M1816_006359 [Peltula sp. TS41687]